MTGTEKVARLLRDTGVEAPAGLRVIRVYAGRHQRAAGAWSWYAVDTTGAEVCGSAYPLRDLRPGQVLLYRGDASSPKAVPAILPLCNAQLDGQAVFQPGRWCHRRSCEGATWTCRCCSRLTCEHYCSMKDGPARVATCGRCQLLAEQQRR